MKASPTTGGKLVWWLLEVDGDEGVKPMETKTSYKSSSYK
jgi:hypothetical protein